MADDKRGNFLSQTAFNIRTTDILAGNFKGLGRIETDGYAVAGDGGRAEWRATGVTSVPDQGTSDFPNSRIYDAIGTEFILDESYLDPLMFGSTGDGTTDDSAAMQEALDAVASSGWTLRLPRQRTFVVKLLAIDASGSRPFVIEGDGSRFLAPASLGLDEPIIDNLTGGTYTDTDITISGLTFDGNNLTAGSKRTSGLVRFARTTRLNLLNIRVTNTQYIGLETNGSRNIFISDSQFDKCGWQTTSASGGPAIFCAVTSGGGTDGPQDVVISNCIFNDNNWIGIHFSVERGTIAGCDFFNNQEAAIFASHTTDSPCRNISIVGNTIDGILLNNITGVGMEIGLVSGFSVTGNTVKNTEVSGIALTKSYDGVVSGNSIGNNGTVALKAYGIVISALGTGTEQTRNIAISGNNFYDNLVTPVTDGGISISGTGDNAENVTVDGNTFGAELVRTVGAFRILGKWDTANGCHVGFNPGLSAPLTTAFTSTDLINRPMNLVAQVIRVTGISGSISTMPNGAEGQKIIIYWNAGADFGILDTAGGAGQFNLAGGANIAVGTHGEGDTLEVVNIDGDWYETGRSNN